MPLLGRVGPLAAATAAVAVLAGCGTTSGNLLTRGAAQQLTSELNQASKALDEYNCQVAYTALTNFRSDVGQLQGVNATLVRNLSDGASTITQLAADRCPASGDVTTTRPARTRTTTTTTTETITTVTSTSETTPVSSETDTTPTVPESGGGAPTGTESVPAVTVPTPTATTPPTPTTPDSGGAGLGGGTP